MAQTLYREGWYYVTQTRSEAVVLTHPHLHCHVSPSEDFNDNSAARSDEISGLFDSCAVSSRAHRRARAQKRTDGYEGVRTPASSVYTIGDVITTPNTLLSIRFGFNVIELICSHVNRTACAVWFWTACRQTKTCLMNSPNQSPSMVWRIYYLLLQKRLTVISRALGKPHAISRLTRVKTHYATFPVPHYNSPDNNTVAAGSNFITFSRYFGKVFVT